MTHKGEGGETKQKKPPYCDDTVIETDGEGGSQILGGF